MNIAANIKRLREDRGMTQEELAKAIGMSRPAVTQWETGWSQPRMGTIEKLAAFFDVSKSEIIDGPSAAKDELPAGARIPSGSTATVPMLELGKIHAGDPMEALEDAHEVQVPERIKLAHPRGFLLRVVGDCMNRRYPEGCDVLVDPMREPRVNDAVAVSIGDDVLLRVWLRGRSSLVLVSDSYEDHEDLVFTEEEAEAIRLMGTVVWFQQALD